MPGQVVRRSASNRLGSRYGKNRPFTPIPSSDPPPPPSQQPATVHARQAKCCDDPKYEVYEGAKICINCGTQISEQNIVAEVTFGETSTGAATVQGGFVGETARHAKTLGAAASRRIGGQYQSREETEQNGRSELRQLCPLLRIPQNVEEIAFNLWKLAAAQNFIQGRRTNEVAGVCLYAACRRERQNTILLMDISEALSVNVFRLGDIYKELSKALYLEVHSHVQPVAEIEPLLMKYCTKLEFGDKTRQVAEDAARIVKRMKRDWMVTGRHPSGLCGACIVLAARMNNFRRTVREIVYIVKVSEITIGSRLAEFKRTRSSTMSVDEFRAKSHRLKHQHDPPSINAAEKRHKRLKVTIDKRSAREEARRSQSASETGSVSSRQSSAAPSDSQDNGSEASSSQQETTTTEPRRDAEGFAIPGLPASQTENADGAAAQPKKPDFALEHELEHDIENILQDPNCVSARDDTEREKLTKLSEQLAAEQRTLSATASAARLAGQGMSTTAVPDSEEIGEWEFADDPEVQNAVLSEEMVRVKETIWLRDNEDWLRQQQAKFLKAELERADGGRDKKKKKRKRSRMGDGTVLTEGGTPVMSPADAAQRMLEKRGGKNISKAINYAMLNQVFGGDVGPSESEKKRMAREKRSRNSPASSSRASSVASTTSRRPIARLDKQHEVVEAVAEAIEQEGEEQSRPGGEAEPVGEEVEEEAPEEEIEEDEVDDEEVVPDHDGEQSWAGGSPRVDYDDEYDDYEAATRDMTGDFGYGDYE
ncbi:hypothetical protein ANO11243_021240 [Dothideomycetidae sp. 11243]|nr:hypothetical protein ANO11243_021240 [fungal sp. No.11243]